MGTMLDYAGVGWDPIRDADGNFATGIMSALQLSKGTYGDPTSEWYMPAGLFLAERGLIHLIVKVDDLLEAAVHVAQDHVKTFSSMNVDRFVWDALLPVLSTEPSAVFRFPGAGQPNLEGHLKSLALAKQRNGTYTPWSTDQVMYLVVPITAMFAAIPPSVSGRHRWKMVLGGSALGALAASPMGGGVAAPFTADEDVFDGQFTFSVQADLSHSCGCRVRLQRSLKGYKPVPISITLTEWKDKYKSEGFRLYTWS